jgi:hypothetical protein
MVRALVDLVPGATVSLGHRIGTSVAGTFDEIEGASP